MSQAILLSERDMDVPATATAGRAKNSQDMAVTGVIGQGNFAGGWSVQLQGSVDGGTTWLDIGVAITAQVIMQVTGVPNLLVAWPLLRINTTVVGTGAPPAVMLAGYKRNPA